MRLSVENEEKLYSLSGSPYMSTLSNGRTSRSILLGAMVKEVSDCLREPNSDVAGVDEVDARGES